MKEENAPDWCWIDLDSPPLTGRECVGGRLGLICHTEGRDGIISSLPGLSRLGNGTVIIGCLRGSCVWVSENKLINKGGFGAIVMKIAASSECHDALPAVSWNSARLSTVFSYLPKSAHSRLKLSRRMSSRKAVSQIQKTIAGAVLDVCWSGKSAHLPSELGWCKKVLGI